MARAILAQGLVFLLLILLRCVLPNQFPTPLWGWALLQGAGAALLGRRWRLGWGWVGFQAALPMALLWQLAHSVTPPWIYPAFLLVLLLVFGGGVLTRVPLYNSNRAAWAALLEWVPEGQGVNVADLGAGLGGPIQFLGRRRPLARCVGIEASPLVWWMAWLRTLPLRKNCRIQFGSFWNFNLKEFQVVYAFLSPVPMAELWAKACREMEPGSVLISNTFAVPGVVPGKRIFLPGRRDACLLVYRLSDNQEPARGAERNKGEV